MSDNTSRLFHEIPLFCAAIMFRLLAVLQIRPYVRPRLLQGKPIPASAIFAAASMGDTIALDRIIAVKADVNARWNDFTPLMAATIEGRRRAVKRLLAAKVDPNGRHTSGMTALLCAIRNQDYPIVEMLLQHGASVKAFFKDD